MYVICYTKLRMADFRSILRYNLYEKKTAESVRAKFCTDNALSMVQLSNLAPHWSIIITFFCNLELVGKSANYVAGFIYQIASGRDCKKKKHLSKVGSIARFTSGQSTRA